MFSCSFVSEENRRVFFLLWNRVHAAKSEGLGSQGPTPASLKQSRQHQSHSNQAAQQRRTKATGEKLLYSMDGRLPKRTKLSVVVSDAVRRWFLDTEMEAERGDVVSNVQRFKV